MDILTGLHIIKDGVCFLSSPVALYRTPRREYSGRYLWYNTDQLNSNGIRPGNLLQEPGRFVNGVNSIVSSGTSSLEF